MTGPRAAILRPWTAPLALSVALHAVALGGVAALQGLVQPPGPEPVIPVELVFAAAPATPAGGMPAPPSTPALPPPPLRGRAGVGGGSAAPAPVAEEPTPVLLAAFATTLPPLPRPKPKPPPDPTAIAALKEDAAKKTLQPVSPPASPPAGTATAPLRQAMLTSPVAQAVPPRWGVPGLANAPPRYPLAARRRGAEGRVVLRVRVLADGHADTVTVARTSGHRLLDEAARRAVAGWRFAPGKLAGIPVAASVDVSVTFRLKD